MEKKHDEKEKVNKVSFFRRGKVVLAMMIALAVLILLTLTVLIITNRQMNQVVLHEQAKEELCKRHFAFITEDSENPIFQEIFEGCLEEGKESGSAIEWLGQGKESDYTQKELMELAIAANVDGIIVEGNSDEGLTAMIEQASDKGIPVVTVFYDCYGSARKSFVGAQFYSFGREYARQILINANSVTKNVLIFLNNNGSLNEQNIVCNGIRGTFQNEGNQYRIDLQTVLVDTSSTFSAQEDIRKTLLSLSSMPDIIICPDAVTTDCLYRTAVDFNLIGALSILGFYTEKSTIEAVDKGSMLATITTDFHKMGNCAVESLNDFLDTGYVSDMITQEAVTINHTNVKDYLS